MEVVKIRELKAHLTLHLKRVQSGARLAVSEHGRVIAIISPVEESTGVGWALRLVAEGRARWSGGKPIGSIPRTRSTPSGRTVSDAALEDRG